MSATQSHPHDQLLLPKPPPEAFGRGEHLTDRSRNGESDKADKSDEKTDAKEDKDEKEEKKSDEKKPPPKPLYQRPVLMSVLIGVAVFAIGAGIAYWLYSRDYESTDDAFIDGHVIAMGPKVAAFVKNVLIDDNLQVKAGDKLIDLDPTDYEVALQNTKAGVATADGRIAEADAMLQSSTAQAAQAEADLQVAKAQADNAQQDYERFHALPDAARSRQQLDNATAAKRQTAAQVTSAAAKVLAARAQITSAQQGIVTAKAQKSQAQAQVRQAEVNLSYCTIVAPADGRITRKNVEPGAYVGIGQVLFSVVPANVWVTANYKETQLKLMHPGQDVTISIDAFPQRAFRGKVDSIQSGTGSRFSLLPAENATGNYVKVVQRVPVKILFDKGELDADRWQIAPGMSVEPRVRVRQ